MDRRIVVGIDIGGTFTDVLCWDVGGELLRSHKVLTRYDDFSAGVMDGLTGVLDLEGIAVSDVSAVVHATTLASNALIERKGARTGLLVTDGYRDILEAGTGQPYDIYDLFLVNPRPLVPRQGVREVSERMSAFGEVISPLDLDGLSRSVDELLEQGVEAVAVMFLHSYRNPAHEQAVAELMARRAPELTFSLSSDVSPEFREYERASTTVANVYVKPIVSRYLGTLSQRLSEAGFAGSFYIMLSSGGMALPRVASELPVRMVESGPAAGALAARDHGRLVGANDLLSFDMGGTTAKVCLIRGGEVSTTSMMEVARENRFKPGSGLPLRTPALDLLEVGAGGGSIAHLDEAGRLRVGPESAGADPGPACYGLGGKLPTVTDACVVLGYYGTSSFLGGEMALDAEAARAAIREHIADPFGVDVVEAAWGIFALAAENMAAAARVHCAEKAIDPRRSTVLAFGGAGPAFGHRVARILGSPKVVVPPGAGVGSTHGLVAAPLSFDFARSQPQRLDEIDWLVVDDLLARLREEAAAVLAEARVPNDRVEVRTWVDMCLYGQSYEVTVPVDDVITDEHDVEALRAAFEQIYEGRYGRRALDMTLQVLTWRVRAREVRNDVEQLAAARKASRGIDDAPGGVVASTREAYFPETQGFTDCAVQRRAKLASEVGAREGPMVIEDSETTIVVGPGATVHLDPLGNVVIDLEERR